MKNLGSLLLVLSITFFQLASFEPVKAELGKSGDEKGKTCVDACSAFSELPSRELKACVASCRAQPVVQTL